ncbi:MAG: hypothetical protein AAB250_05360, partial [Bdellovibrionota bacterium]
MKPAISKQAALKALLLAVLAANVSWQPFKALHSYDAAQVADRESSPVRTSRAEESARITPAPGAQPAERAAPAARSTVETVATTKHEETRQWCGQAILIRWEAVPGQNQVREQVILRYPDNRVLLQYTESGSFATLVQNVEARDQGLESLERLTRPKLGSACASTVTVAAGTTTSAGTNTSAISAEERTRRAADVAACRKTSDGKTLDSMTRLECNQERLSTIGAFDEDDRAEKRKAQQAFNDIVKQIRKDLGKEVKTSLMSDDDEAAARSLVDTAIETITDAGDEIGISKAVIQRAVTDIRNMYGAMYKGKELKDLTDLTKSPRVCFED